jgi:AAA+ superfamily predicted ATPase
MDNKYFSDIYDDFFRVEKKELVVKEDNNEDITIDIDSLYLDNESKNLLKQIIDYMDKFSKKEETNYINFNIIISGNNTETVNSIVSILKKSVNVNHYVDGNNAYDLSLYDLNNKVDINELYNKNGILNIKDLSSILMQDENNKKMFFYNLKNNLDKKKITILSGNENDIELFLTYDNDLRTKNFNFKLIEIMPTIQDIYNEVMNKTIVSDENKVKLLDYITDSYKEITDYISYRDKLVSYLAFNKEVPSIREVKTIDEVFKELDSLVGLYDVKKVLRDLVNLISLKDKSDLKISNVNLHMLFLGNPGTGKTTVARCLSDILYNLGYIKENKLLEVSSKDLVAEYVGQTAIKTYSVIERALGGVLFIDEAYSLSSKNNSYNDEAIATLIKAMEDNRDNLVVIFAGYTKEMQDFINSNSGIASRIGYTLNFKDYTEEELLEIFKGMVNKAGFKITNEALYKARNIIKEHLNDKNFGNARFVRNMYEKTVTEHATNTKDKRRKDVLITLTDKDINIDNVL